MIARLVSAGLILAATLPAGCLPETRISWSPDGKLALVRGGDGLYLCDGDGKLSPRVAENVTAMAWLPDSRRFIAVTNQPLATWDELVPHLSQARREAAMHEAAMYRAEALAWKGDWQEFRFLTPPSDVRAALVCLRDTHGKELEGLVGPKWSDLKDLRYTIQNVRLFDVAEGKATESKQLFESLEPIAEIRVSPGGKAFAWTAPPYPALGAEAAFALYVAPLADPEHPAKVTDRVSVFFDWAADGRTLVYASTGQPDAGGAYRKAYLAGNEEPLVYRRQHMPESARGTPRLGFIFKCMVVDEDGSLVKDRSADAVAQVPFSDALPLRCLKTGRVLFAAPEVHLPVPAGTDPQHALSTAALEKPNDVKPAPAPEAASGVRYRLDLFQLSPDEMRLALFSSQDRIAIVELATGKVDAAPSEPAGLWPTQGGTSSGLPAWRSNQELCFVAVTKGAAGAKGRLEVVLWSREGARVLSKDWPEAVRKGWLDR